MRRLREDGFAMPMVIFMIVIMSIVAYAALVQANISLNLAYKQAYLQMARMASKAAIDYAQESFDQASCGNYTGTPETDLVSNGNYRVTFRSEVVSTSADGYEKVINGTGSVYLPRQSDTARYVIDVRSEVVRTYALCKTPDNFDPVVWLDASDEPTLKKSGTVTTTNNNSSAGSVLDLLLPHPTVEEKVTDGTQGLLSWLSNDLEMHTCDSLEYALIMCITNSSKYLYTGLVFQNINVPKDSIITSATISLAGATPSGNGGSLTHRLRGIYETSTDPHMDLFTSLASNQVRSRVTNSSLRTTATVDVTTNNFPPGNSVQFDVKSIVQEMVNNPNWNPTGSGNGGRIGFAVERVSGNGERKALKNGVSISVSYSSTVVSQALNGDNLSEWSDKSADANHARFVLGNAPTRVDGQIDGKPVIRFNNGVLASTLASTLTGREFTVFAVVKPNFSTSSDFGRLATGMLDTATDDTLGNTGIIPLLRNGSSSGIRSVYSGNTGGSYATTDACGSICSGQPYLMVSNFEIANDDTITAILKGNGAQTAINTGFTPSAATPPYTYSINQLYFGGRRTGAMPGTATDFFNGDYAEVVVYDKTLACRDIEALEEYFRNKWALAPSQYVSTCPVSTVPTL